MSSHRLILTVLAALVFFTSVTYSAPNAAAAASNVFRLEPVVLVEEPAIGTLVLDLAAPLSITDTQLGDFKFRFYSPQSLTAHYFLIDPLTGHVKTQRALDREYLCETKVCGPCATSNCTLPVEIVVAKTVVNFLFKSF